MKQHHLKLMIAEPSAIVRSGLCVQLHKLSGFSLQISEENAGENLLQQVLLQKPDVLIVNPSLIVDRPLFQWKEEAHCPHLKYVALLTSLLDRASLQHYDEQLSIYDSQEELRQKLDQLCVDTSPATEELLTLSAREREVVVCIVKGMTNREIASALFISTHTVVTHRRNISRKLQIHSASALTVYAIVNKLVQLNEVRLPSVSAS